MKKVILLITIIFLLSGCFNKNEIESSSKMEDIEIIINNDKYSVTLEDNDTTREFLSVLPLDIEMTELNGNEKYIYLDKKLPTNETSIDKIEAGDIMLFGDNCLVIFYESFNTSYKYTKIGHISNLKKLGKENIKVKISKI